MQNQKLMDALSALKKVTKGDGVVAMDAEALAKYAEEQIAKAASDDDKGDARIAALTTVVTEASDVFKANPAAKYEFIPHAEAPTEGSLEALARDVATIKALLSKQDVDATEPTTTVIHPPPIPEGFDGGSVSTNQPQGDDNGPRGEATKSDSAPADEPAADAPAEVAAKADEPADEPVEKSEDFVWPTDMAHGAREAKAEQVAKAAKSKKAPVDWGSDNATSA